MLLYDERTDAEASRLAERAAIVHARLCAAYLTRLNWPDGEKVRLIEALLASLRTNPG